MSVDRPTFSESWHQVANLKARLRGFVQAHRQYHRGRLSYILRDPSNNRFFQLNEAGYHFVGLLDGRRTVADAWDLANQHLGDRAPTQGEAIQLLGQLYSSNLLSADLPPDAEGLLKRQQKRVRREVRSYMMNLLFARIPLFDPDRLLDSLIAPLRWVFGPVGIVCWLGVIFFGLWSLAGRTGQLWSESTAFFGNALTQPMELFWLYLSFAAVKALHELGHGLACKRFGEAEQVSGEVHQVGIMLLVLMPVPYVDASSSWGFRSKWRRAMVGAAGMYVELAAAAVAAFIWANTAQGALAHAIAYNVIFIASVSTILFNGNPLLRFDGYYILSDLLEIPNLNPRSKQFLYYLVKRFAYGVRAPRDPSHGRSERIWLVLYAIASTIYRVLIVVGILLFIANKLFFLGMLLAAGAVIGWVFVPLGKFAHYLFTSPELARVRPRAMLTTVCGLAGIIVPLAIVPVPDHGRAQGIVEPPRFVRMHTKTPGFLTEAQVEAQPVTANGAPLVIASNTELHNQRDLLDADRRVLLWEWRKFMAEQNTSQQQQVELKQKPLAQRVQTLDERIADLQLRAPFDGMWVPRRLDHEQGAYLDRGKWVGWLASTDTLQARVVTDQYFGPLLAQAIDVGAKVEVRAIGQPEPTWTGRITRIIPAGQTHLPNAALAKSNGGTIEMKPDTGGSSGRPEAREDFFEIHVQLSDEAVKQLRMHQRVIVRFNLPPKPILSQGWHWLRQLVQQRLQI